MHYYKILTSGMTYKFLFWDYFESINVYCTSTNAYGKVESGRKTYMKEIKYRISVLYVFFDYYISILSHITKKQYK